jgi:endogenous inhibitor of DNA gyrase (YacG/DUF329 family)
MASRLVTCPTCQRRVAWSADSPFRPFCSERCRLIDLGAWVSEQRGIPGDESLPTDGEGAPPSVLPDPGDEHDPRH